MNNKYLVPGLSGTSVGVAVSYVSPLSMGAAVGLSTAAFVYSWFPATYRPKEELSDEEREKVDFLREKLEEVSTNLVEECERLVSLDKSGKTIFTDRLTELAVEVSSLDEEIKGLENETTDRFYLSALAGTVAGVGVAVGVVSPLFLGAVAGASATIAVNSYWNAPVEKELSKKEIDDKIKDLSVRIRADITSLGNLVEKGEMKHVGKLAEKIESLQSERRSLMPKVETSRTTSFWNWFYQPVAA